MQICYEYCLTTCSPTHCIMPLVVICISLPVAPVWLLGAALKIRQRMILSKEKSKVYKAKVWGRDLIWLGGCVKCLAGRFTAKSSKDTFASLSRPCRMKASVRHTEINIEPWSATERKGYRTRVLAVVILFVLSVFMFSLWPLWLSLPLCVDPLFVLICNMTFTKPRHLLW